MSISNSALTHVTAAFANTFPKDNIDPDSDFFDLGGDSMTLVALCTCLEAQLGLEVHPTLLLYHPTVSELSAELETKLRKAADPNAAN